MPLIINHLPVDARVSGYILNGPSALNDTVRFVWGGSLLKGKVGKYYLYYVGSSDPALEILERKSF